MPQTAYHALLHNGLQAALRASRLSQRTLATVGGFADTKTLRDQRDAAALPVTRLTYDRWQRVAEVVGYTGDLFDQSAP